MLLINFLTVSHAAVAVAKNPRLVCVCVCVCVCMCVCVCVVGMCVCVPLRGGGGREVSNQNTAFPHLLQRLAEASAGGSCCLLRAPPRKPNDDLWEKEIMEGISVRRREEREREGQ